MSKNAFIRACLAEHVANVGGVAVPVAEVADIGAMLEARQQAGRQPYAIAWSSAEPETSRVHAGPASFADALQATGLPVILLERSVAASTVDLRRCGDVRIIHNPLTPEKLAKALAPVGVAEALPRFSPVQATDLSTPAYGMGRIGPGLSILIAEDNPVNVEVLTGFLRLMQPDLAIEIVSDGFEALDAYRRRQPDLVLMDCQMPGMDGLTTVRRMREIEIDAGLPRIAAVAVTANAFEADRRRCLEAGFDAFLRKPFTPHELADVLGQLGLTATDTEYGAAASSPQGLPEAAGDNVAARLDLAVLEEFRQNYPTVFARLIATFLDYLPGQIARMAEAGRDGDMRTLATIAHNLKSSSANVGARHLAEMASRAETSAMQQLDVQPALVHAMVGEIEQEALLVAAELKRACEKATAAKAEQAAASDQVGAA